MQMGCGLPTCLRHCRTIPRRQKAASWLSAAGSPRASLLDDTDTPKNAISSMTASPLRNLPLCGTCGPFPLPHPQTTLPRLQFSSLNHSHDCCCRSALQALCACSCTGPFSAA